MPCSTKGSCHFHFAEKCPAVFLCWTMVPFAQHSGFCMSSQFSMVAHVPTGKQLTLCSPRRVFCRESGLAQSIGQLDSLRLAAAHSHVRDTGASGSSGLLQVSFNQAEADVAQTAVGVRIEGVATWLVIPRCSVLRGSLEVGRRARQLGDAIGEGWRGAAARMARKGAAHAAQPKASEVGSGRYIAGGLRAGAAVQQQLCVKLRPAKMAGRQVLHRQLRSVWSV